jgi:glycosyltransferase involved in cell wall biosynthesis
LRGWDRRSAGRVDSFVANSTAVAERIKRSYGRSAQIIFPPVDTEFFCPAEEVRRGDTFLYVGRLVSYKRPDVVIEAFRGSSLELSVVGEGHLRKRLEAGAPPNVRFVGVVSDEELRELYRSARALVYAGEEDFGIAMAEALACGTPVVAYRDGGAADIVDDGETGYLFAEQTAAAARASIERVAATELDSAHIRRRAERFSRLRFRRELRGAVEELLAATSRA